ncbi:MAG: ATP-dependent DNA helicase RecG [Chloroflexia bacterium]|nr:ATP-dependent DNA helicase RecG [Chloroflexia bacterium]
MATRRPQTTERLTPGAGLPPAALFERLIDALRRAWLTPDASDRDIRLADQLLHRLVPRVAATHEVASALDDAIQRLGRLSQLRAERRREIERVATSLKAIQPHIGLAAGGTPVGKLNAALGEKRAGRPAPTPVTLPAPRRQPAVTPLSPQASITSLPRIGSKVAEKLHKLRIDTVGDALRFAPRRHIDYSNVVAIGEPLGLRGDVTVRGEIIELREHHGPGVPRVTVRIFDGTGSMRITWFNTFIARQISEGDEIYASGTIEGGYGGLQLTSPEWERVGGPALSTGGLIPVYPSTQGLAQKTLRAMTRNALDAATTKVEDWLPPLRPYLPGTLADRLPPLTEAYEHLHYPTSLEQFQAARARLTFEDLLLLQVGLVKRKRERKAERGRAIAIDHDDLETYLATLPFALTGAQRRSIAELAADLGQPRPMTRLLQGDVGSGKTVVAAACAWLAKRGGMQTAVMAPTEILAQQHERNLTHLFAGVRPDDQPCIALLTGATKAAERRNLAGRLASGEVDILVGTHALIQRHVAFHKLGLVVIDEQHRFGVKQRDLLIEKSLGLQPHLLSMTATPIPRTLNLVLHGDLDVSLIDERPPGRIPITTRRFLGPQRAEAYAVVREEIARGHQAFVICPLVEASAAIEARAAVAEAERLQREVFPDLRVAVLHGRMASRDKDATMAAFRARETDILVATSVIEVGIDIPNATVMLIEGADRFGLSQLHQFRGRVGRGGARSYCLLLADESTPDGEERLQTMVATDDGFLLAEKDLELRGPGDFIGTRQSGLPELGWLDHGFDTRLLDDARQTAEAILAHHPDLTHPDLNRLNEAYVRFWASAQTGQGLS